MPTAVQWHHNCPQALSDLWMTEEDAPAAAQVVIAEDTASERRKRSVRGERLASCAVVHGRVCVVLLTDE